MPIIIKEGLVMKNCWLHLLRAILQFSGCAFGYHHNHGDAPVAIRRDQPAPGVNPEEVGKDHLPSVGLVACTHGKSTNGSGGLVYNLDTTISMFFYNAPAHAAASLQS